MELKLTAGREGRLSSFLTGELGLSTGLLNRRKRDDSIQVNGVHQWMDYLLQIIVLEAGLIYLVVLIFAVNVVLDYQRIRYRYPGYPY